MDLASLIAKPSTRARGTTALSPIGQTNAQLIGATGIVAAAVARLTSLQACLDRINGLAAGETSGDKLEATLTRAEALGAVWLVMTRRSVESNDTPREWQVRIGKDTPIKLTDLRNTMVRNQERNQPALVKNGYIPMSVLFQDQLAKLVRFSPQHLNLCARMYNDRATSRDDIKWFQSNESKFGSRPRKAEGLEYAAACVTARKRFDNASAKQTGNAAAKESAGVTAVVAMLPKPMMRTRDALNHSETLQRLTVIAVNMLIANKSTLPLATLVDRLSSKLTDAEKNLYDQIATIARNGEKNTPVGKLVLSGEPVTLFDHTVARQPARKAAAAKRGARKAR